MKRLLFIIELLFLSILSAFTQDKIDKPTFEKIVDYANCKYLMAFIEKHDAGKPYIKNSYEITIKSELQKANLDNLEQIPTFEKIISLFPKGSNDIASQLSDRINKRKGDYANCQNNSRLIESLGTTGWAGIDLTETATSIQNDIRAKFNVGNYSKQVSEQEVVKNQTIQTSSQVEELQENIAELEQQYVNLKTDSTLIDLQSSLNFFKLLLFILSGIILLLFSILVITYKRIFNANNDNSVLKRFIKNIVLNSTEISNKFAVNTIKENNKMKPNEDKILKIEKQLVELKELINRISENKKPDSYAKVVEPLKTTIEHIIFYRSKQGKILQDEVSNKSDGAFKVFNINGNEAKFEYCGNVVNSDYFTDICVFENNPADIPNKTEIKTTSPGTVKKINEGNWEVYVPAKIKFL